MIRMNQMNEKTMLFIEMMKIIAFIPKTCRMKQLQIKLGIFSELDYSPIHKNKAPDFPCSY